MANQISQLADVVRRLDTQQGKFLSQPTLNVQNVSAISVSYTMNPLPEEPVGEPMEIVSALSSPKKHGVIYTFLLMCPVLPSLAG